jgi:hypothetical protein
MKNTLSELWNVFVDACKETPRGMAAPFIAFWKAATHNPVLEKQVPYTNNVDRRLV